MTLRTSSVVIADPYTDNRDNGAFILIDETSNDTVGAGTIIEPREVKPGAQTRNDIRWHPSALDRDHRCARPPASGAPPSGSPGCPRRASRPSPSPSNVRWSNPVTSPTCSTATTCGTDCPTTWASPPGDRAENIRRVGHLTRLLADAGVVALASLVSPLKSDREIARALNDAAKLPFIEVYVVDVAGGVREARSQGALRACPRGRAQGPDRCRRTLRGPGKPGPGARHHRRRHRRARRPGDRAARRKASAADLSDDEDAPEREERRAVRARRIRLAPAPG